MTNTDDQAAAAGPDAEGASWRQLDPHLWVGHDGTVSLGTIERGARYVFIDADGAAHPGVGSLHDAQVLATGPIRLPARPAATPEARSRFGVLVLPAVVLAGVPAGPRRRRLAGRPRAPHL